MEPILFRLLTPADKPALLQLLSDRQDESNTLHGGSTNIVKTEGGVIFDQMLAADWITTFVGEKDGQLVATVTIYLLPRIRAGGIWAILEDVLIAPAYRGQGVGKQLMTYAIEYCSKIPHVKKVKLGSRKDETGVHEFYEKLGFEFKEKLFQLSLKKKE